MAEVQTEDFYLPDPELLKALESESDVVIQHPDLITKGIEVVKPEDVKVNFGLVEGEELFYCPYNRSHQVVYARYTQHLQKCRHNYLNAVKQRKPVVKMEVCPYRPALHHMSEFYMKRHLVKCPQRQGFLETLDAFENVTVSSNAETVERWQKMSEPEGAEAKVFTLELPAYPAEEDGDKFEQSFESDLVDSEGEAGGYDPKIKLAQGFYYSKPHGLTKSEKKEHYQEEAIRFEKFKGELGDKSAQPATENGTASGN